MKKKFSKFDLFFKEKSSTGLILFPMGIIVFFFLLAMYYSSSTHNESFGKEFFWEIIFANIFIVGGIAAVWTTYKRAILRHRLHNYGEKAIGTITFYEARMTRMGYIANIKYEFFDLNGKKYRGKNFHQLWADKMEGFEVGSEIEIVYEKNNPKKNFWVEENEH